MNQLVAPLYTDPVHLAPTDPTVVEGPDGRWHMFYTQRRAGDVGPGVTWIHGTDIGTATSEDGGLTWHYRGVVTGLDSGTGRNTWWAPEVIFAEGQFHMFASYIDGVPSGWAGHERHILHHTSDDLFTWTSHGIVPLSSDRVIDAAVHARPDGGYRLWFKDEEHGSWTWSSDSQDLYMWGACSPVITGAGHEGPNVFELGGWHWLIVDEWQGLAVYRAAGLEGWERHGLILDQPGDRTLDHGIGRHADVVVGRTSADEPVGWIFYFTHRIDHGDDSTRQSASEQDAIEAHRTDIHVAQLHVSGGRLWCDRDEAVDLDLRRASRYNASHTRWARSQA